jgi:putative ABC transport system ATP-binding protein
MSTNKASRDGKAFIQCKDLSKTYIRGPDRIPAVSRVNLAIAVGEFVAVVGPSGSGKSTFMNLLGCLDRPTSGSLFYGDDDVSRFDLAELAAFRNRVVGFVFQQFNLLPSLTAVQNVALPLIYRGCSRNERLERAERMLTSLGLADRLDHFPDQLSGGQQQRVAIGRALVGEPNLLLADEPTGALDSRTSAEILDLLEGLNGNSTTLIIVTHDPSVASRASRVVRFEDGEIV